MAAWASHPFPIQEPVHLSIYGQILRFGCTPLQWLGTTAVQPRTSAKEASTLATPRPAQTKAAASAWQPTGTGTWSIKFDQQKYLTLCLTMHMIDFASKCSNFDSNSKCCICSVRPELCVLSRMSLIYLFRSHPMSIFKIDQVDKLTQKLVSKHFLNIIQTFSLKIRIESEP